MAKKRGRLNDALDAMRKRGINGDVNRPANRPALSPKRDARTGKFLPRRQGSGRRGRGA